MPRNIRDMVVVITGASSGIGRKLAEMLHPLGAKLVLCARRIEMLEALNRDLGGRHLCVRIDVGRREDCQLLIDRAVQHFGRIDTLVCNAGFSLLRRVSEMSAQEYARIFQTNLFGTTDCMRAAVPVMAGQDLRDGYRGQIMIVSSAAARRGLPYAGAYSATKAAQLSLAEAARVELAPQKIAVTSVHPIATETEIFETAEQLSGRLIDQTGKRPKRHSMEHVVRGMLRAIERPCAEVWSSRFTRWLIPIGTLFPSLADRAMARECAEFEKLNAIDRAG
jgi:NAD(P)-dependent dehydrogenase (short-subunit alcohol dehydrogenase family)